MNRYSNVLSYSPFKEGTTDHHGYFKIKYFNNYFGARYYLDIISGEHNSKFQIPIKDRKSHSTSYLYAYSHFKIRIKNNLSNNATVIMNFNATRDYNDYYNYYYPSYFYPKANEDITETTIFRGMATMALPFTWYYSTPSLPSSIVYYDTIPASTKLDTITHLIQIN